MESLCDSYSSVGSGTAVAKCNGSRLFSPISPDLNSSLECFDNLHIVQIFSGLLLECCKDF